MGFLHGFFFAKTLPWFLETGTMAQAESKRRTPEFFGRWNRFAPQQGAPEFFLLVGNQRLISFFFLSRAQPG